MATFENFHRNTFANYTTCERPDRTPDFVSPCGSQYWHEGNKVVRFSDHWNFQIKSCAWVLNGDVCYNWEAGECNLDEFICPSAKFEVLPINLLAQDASYTLFRQIDENKALCTTSF